MRIRIVQIWLVVGLLCLCACQGFAQGKKWALLIGIEEYDNSDVSQLRFAVRDVQAVAKQLPLIGFPAANIRTMSSNIKASNDINRPINTNVLKALDYFAGEVGAEDTFLLYFTGHGFSKDGQTFLGSVNVDPSSIETLQISGIPVALLQSKMKKFKARQVIFVVDACRNDPEKGKGDSDNKRTKDLGKSLIVAARPDGAAIGGSALLFACREGERAFEDAQKEQGVFTSFFLEALQGKAVRNQSLTMADITEYVQRQVIAWAKQNQKQQTPELIQVGAGNIVLSTKITVNVEVTTSVEITPSRPSQPIVVSDKIRHNPKDGAEMSWIPGGQFTMGSNLVNRAYVPHIVRLTRGYWMYQTLVTVSQYEKFCRETGRPMPLAPEFNADWKNKDHPIVNVLWNDAMAYCTWAGGTLPTEAQWERAAKGPQGFAFPWGNAFDSSMLQSSKIVVRDAGGTCAVGKFPANGFGLYDMAGNVWQYCLDYWDYSFYNSPAAQQLDPVNTIGTEEEGHILRGGGWPNINVSDFLCANRYRFTRQYPFFAYGFRCVIQ